jgi:K+ transporter
MVMIGTCMVIGDGVLTPAISGMLLLSSYSTRTSSWSLD